MDQNFWGGKAPVVTTEQAITTQDMSNYIHDPQGRSNLVYFNEYKT